MGQRCAGIHPDGFVPCLARGAMGADGLGDVDVAQFFRVHVIVRHIDETPESAYFTGVCDAPAGFLEHFAVQRLEGAFARINSATGQLVFEMRRALVGQQKSPCAGQNCVNTGAVDIPLADYRIVAIPFDHRLPPWTAHLPRLYSRDMPIPDM